MRVVVTLLCVVAVWAAGVSINHAYLAGRYLADAPGRAFDLHSSSLMYGSVGLIGLAVALALHVRSGRRRGGDRGGPPVASAP